MLQLPGSPALSDFRIAKLIARLRAIEGAVQRLTARYLHFADVTRNLEKSEVSILERLLTYGPRMPAASDADSGSLLLVVPRAGTISPWSSKATDIAQVC